MGKEYRNYKMKCTTTRSLMKQVGCYGDRSPNASYTFLQYRINRNVTTMNAAMICCNISYEFHQGLGLYDGLAYNSEEGIDK